MTTQTTIADTLAMTVAIARLLRATSPTVSEETGTLHLEGPGWQMNIQPEVLPTGEMLATLYVHICTYLNPAICAHGALRYIHPDEADSAGYTLSIDGYPIGAASTYAEALTVFNNLTGQTCAVHSATYAQYIAWLEVQCGKKVAGLDVRIDTEGWLVAGPEPIPFPGCVDNISAAEEE